MRTDQCFFRVRIEVIPDAEIRDELDGQIAAFCHDRGDPDDGYTPVGIVTPLGRILGIVPEESRKDLGGDGTHIWAGVPKSRRWAWTQVLALRAVAQDLEMFRDVRDSQQATRKIESLSFDDLLKAIHEEVPSRLAQAYRKMAVAPPPPRGGSRVAVAESRAFRIAEAYRLLRQAEVPPFADDRVSPGVYRAFHLHGTADANAIAVVNIHT